jgi:hypothetical protein
MNAEMQLESGRRKAVWGSRVRLGAAIAGVVLAASCSDAIRTGQGSSYLVIDTITGGGNSATVESDVISDEGGILQDSGQASFTLVMKDQGGPGPSPVNAITLTQYHVEYIRSDGRTVQGVDVPFAFDGGLTLTVNGAGSVGFTLVRAQAKHEAPLKALADHGGAQHISTIARVTFYGHDQSGREVSVSGNIEVNFADWAG